MLIKEIVDVAVGADADASEANIALVDSAIQCFHTMLRAKGTEGGTEGGIRGALGGCMQAGRVEGYVGWHVGMVRRDGTEGAAGLT